MSPLARPLWRLPEGCIYPSWAALAVSWAPVCQRMSFAVPVLHWCFQLVRYLGRVPRL